ncbi:DnaJ domain [Seminavis robusta]|uniref:DnaJ domain n=1 Tax=Seminavis robusta TaxID=568900 RepID=A0A9N8EZ05_9STRA|nr:DnaJ domain [Seminavis robusta]|eukprot:Sro1978_g309000.1 DnaJ domain (237) ;mRNA; f:4063-4773
MMKVAIAALLALQGATAFAPVYQSRPTTALNGRSGAASSKEEDLMLTLKVIMDHAERSTTASKDQFISQMEEAAKVVEEEPEPVDISVPYDAAAVLAYEAAGSPGDFAAFKTQFEDDAVADVIAKNAPPVDISVPYDAAAKNAYEAAGSSGDYAAFKEKFEADAVADVIAKNAPPAEEEPEPEPVVDISVPYDAAAKLAYDAAGGSGDFAAFKEKFEADAVADVVAKQKKPEAVSA